MYAKTRNYFLEGRLVLRSMAKDGSRMRLQLRSKITKNYFPNPPLFAGTTRTRICELSKHNDQKSLKIAFADEESTGQFHLEMNKDSWQAYLNI